MTTIFFNIIHSFKTLLTVTMCLSAATIFSSGTIRAETLLDGLYAQMKTSKGERTSDPELVKTEIESHLCNVFNGQMEKNSRGKSSEIPTRSLSGKISNKLNLDFWEEIHFLIKKATLNYFDDQKLLTNDIKEYIDEAIRFSILRKFEKNSYANDSSSK